MLSRLRRHPRRDDRDRLSRTARSAGSVTPAVLMAAGMLLAVAMTMAAAAAAAAPAGADPGLSMVAALGPLREAIRCEQHGAPAGGAARFDPSLIARTLPAFAIGAAGGAAWRQLDLPPPSNA